MKHKSSFKKNLYTCLIILVLLAAAAGYRLTHKTVVLGYHSISEEPFSEAESLFVRPEELEAQIRMLQDEGYEFIFADEVSSFSLKKRVCLTFDDGYKDNCTVLLPILEKYDVKATVFVAAGLLNFNERFMTMDELVELAESPLVSIGSHGMTHRDFQELSLKEIEEELMNSKRILSPLSHQEITCFAYPGGHYSKEAARLASECYEHCFTFSGARQYVSFWNRRHLIPRISVYRGCSPKELLRLINSARPGRNVSHTY